MNLTQTKRWSDFVEWYIITFKQDAYSQIIVLYDGQSFDSFTVTSHYQNDWYMNFAQLPFEFQEGVYRKFIESLNLNVKIDKQYDYSFILKFDNQIIKSFNTFQELVEWFFNHQ